jgi:putative ABC transport system permease protein
LNNLVVNLSTDVKVLTLNDFIELEKKYWADSSPIGYVFALGAAMGFIVGAVIVYQILYTDVSNHLAEYAMLKAIGYTNIYLLGVVFQEALFLSLLGYIPGFALSSILYEVVAKAARLPMNMNLERVLLVLVLTFLMCFLASAVAVLRLRAADPADIFS